MTAGQDKLIEAILESVGLERLQTPLRPTDQESSECTDTQFREDAHAEKMVERRHSISDLSA